MRWAAFLILLTGCAARMPFHAHPGDNLPSYILEAWGEAQRELDSLEPPLASSPYRVPPHMFMWLEQTRAHRCGGERAGYGGCFSANANGQMVIQYVNEKSTIIHEAKHAIAYAAGDSRWREIPHKEGR